MPKLQGNEYEHIYEAAERFVVAALRSDGSLFTPGQPIWSADFIEDLYQRFVLQPDLSKDSFLNKLSRQLAEAPDSTIQLTAEMLYIHFLIASKVHGHTKREIIHTVLNWMDHPVSIPNELDRVLDSGLATVGIAFHTQRPFQLQLLVNFARKWKTLDKSEQEGILDDPWAFKEFVFSIPVQSAYMQREALLHLVQPDTFERIVARSAKQQIADKFRTLITEPTDDIDRQLQMIRETLESEYGSNFDFYKEPIVTQWQEQSNPWDEFIHWAKRFFEMPDFDEAERDYKLEVAHNLSSARDAVLADSADWLDKLKKGFGKPNNITYWGLNSNFLRWCEEHPTDALEALRRLWAPNMSMRERFDDFFEIIPKQAYNGMQSTIAPFLSMAIDPLMYPPYRDTAYRSAFKMTGYPKFSVDEWNVTEFYEYNLDFLDRIMEEASGRGLELRDRLDAQSVIWCITQWKETNSPIADWPERVRRRLLKFRGKELPDDEYHDEETDTSELESKYEPPSNPFAQLADKLLINQGWLERVSMLLEDKRQTIFFGPPGTGKTYVALEMAQTIAGSEDRVELVQFHPSYAYEDFIEGYRPISKGGQPLFQLVQGPLMRIADKARGNLGQTYVLVIDEINRGNVAKVFGELYFLLEYRDRNISLQYSQEGFALPKNLLIIGTMNTADRSIALIDSALRRRFHFVPFFPDQEPIDGLLRRWLQREKPDLLWVADRLEEANLRLNDPHAAIGPSHFMKANLSPEWVELIWEHSIIPYVAEHFYGQEEQLDAFKLSALAGDVVAQNEDLASAAEEADAPASPD